MNLLERLRALGVEVALDRSNIVLAGRDDALSDELLDEVRAQKPRLIEELRAANRPPPAPRRPCLGCCGALITTAKCHDCAAKATPVTAGALVPPQLRCPQCGKPSWRAFELCLACEGEELAQNAWSAEGEKET